MCEPDDLHRKDKLMKPVVVHDGIKPSRYFLYLFPPEPKFRLQDVGEPVYLTPYLRQGRLEEGKEAARVKGKFIHVLVSSVLGYMAELQRDFFN